MELAVGVGVAVDMEVVMAAADVAERMLLRASSLGKSREVSIMAKE